MIFLPTVWRGTLTARALLLGGAFYVIYLGAVLVLQISGSL